jgi:hypothetical protein
MNTLLTDSSDKSGNTKWADTSWDRDDPIKMFEKIRTLSGLQWQNISSPAPSVFQTAERSHLISGIESCRNLKSNWDGEGALPPSDSCVDTTLVVISLLSGNTCPHDWAPNPNGTISLYWEWVNGRAEFECGNTRFSWVIFDQLLGSTGRVSCSGSTQSIDDGHVALNEFIQYLSWSTAAIRTTRSTQISSFQFTPGFLLELF